jgi:hypothetical protein
MTPVKPQVSKFEFRAEKSCQVGFNVLQGSAREHSLSESSRPYVLAYYLFVHALLLFISFSLLY